MTVFQRIYDWAKAQSADRTYRFYSAEDCVVGQYRTAQGLVFESPEWREVMNVTHDFELELIRWNAKVLLAHDDEATFGAVVERMRQHWPVEA